MSKRSKELRSLAASELRKSRKGGTSGEKRNNRKRASALKSLAESEEWLAGEEPHSATKPKEQ